MRKKITIYYDQEKSHFDDRWAIVIEHTNEVRTINFVGDGKYELKKLLVEELRLNPPEIMVDKPNEGG